MTLSTFPTSGTANFESAARAVFAEWVAAIEGKADIAHTHGADPSILRIVANEAALTTGAQDGELAVCKSNGNRYVWEETGSKWRVLSGNIYTAAPATATYKVEAGTIVSLATGGNESIIRFNGSTWDTIAEEANIIDTVHTWTKGQRGEITSIVSNATLNWDLADSNNFTVTLSTAAHAWANPSNMTAGQSGYIFVVQDATGGRLITSYGSYFKFKEGTAPTYGTAANAVDKLSYIVKSATEIEVSHHGAFS